MSNAARQRGTTAERKVADWLAQSGHPWCERAPRWGAVDKGDLVGCPGIAWQIKDTARLDLAAAVDEATTQAANANADLGIVVRRRKGRPDPADWFAVLPLSVLNRLLRAAGYGLPSPRPDGGV